MSTLVPAVVNPPSRRSSTHPLQIERDPLAPPMLIVGHGTRSTEGVVQFRSFVDRVANELAPRGVTVTGGLIELAAPAVTEAVAGLVLVGHRRVAAVPLMLIAAGHAKGDIPAALKRETERHPGLSYRYGRPLGPEPRILQALEERVNAVLPRAQRADTTLLLVGRGSSDPDANAEVFKAARLLAEGRGFAGVEACFISLAAPSVPAGLDRCTALSAQRVVVLPFFLFAGVLPDRITDQANAWHREHPDVVVSCAEAIGNCDLLARVVIDRYLETLTGDIRSNCDTCMYRVALPGHEHRVGQPQMPHHHPDDPTHQHGPEASHQHHHPHPHGTGTVSVRASP